MKQKKDHSMYNDDRIQTKGEQNTTLKTAQSNAQKMNYIMPKYKSHKMDNLQDYIHPTFDGKHKR